VGPPEEANVMFRFTFGKEGQEWKINRVTMDPGTEARQSPPTPSSTQIPSLDDEAIAAVKDLWDQHTTRCGDSYFSSENFRGIITLHQYKNISFVARRTSPTNEADKLNGILWNGDVQISIGLYRDKHEGQWHEWKQGNKGYDIGATKRQTGWSVLQLLHVTDQRKVKCSEIP
jgi:hypothetical protein